MAQNALSKAIKPVLVLLVLLAIGSCTWLISDGLRLERIHQQETIDRANGYAERSRIAVELRCRPLAPAEEFQCIREENKTAREGAFNQSDLKAQLVTSVWTRQMGIAAIIAMAFGILGVALVFVTFQETRRSADEAKRSADEAKRSADAFINAERPHLMVRPHGFGAKAEGQTMIAGVRLDNFGASPAVLGRLEWVFTGDKKFPGAAIASAQRITFNARPTIEAGASNRGNSITLAQGPGFIAGRISYRSKFGDHVSHFLWEIAQLENGLRLKIRQPNEKNGWPKDS